MQHTSPNSCWHQMSSAGAAGISAHSNGVQELVGTMSSAGRGDPQLQVHGRAPCAELCLFSVLQDSCGLVN